MSGELPLYYFIPAVREGLAAYISGPPIEGERTLVEATLTPVIDDAADPDKSARMWVGLYGPGDVVGFASSVVARTDPRRGCWDYEPNYMPCIEFSEPDLPWRFTPDVAGNEGLMPWIALIVLEAEEHGELVQQNPDPNEPERLPVRWIRNVARAALPDLSEAWRWAHVQVTAGSSEQLTKAQLADRISGAADAPPGHHVARLLCPRRLKARTRYTAFVVPTFKLGQIAAGLPVSLSDAEMPLEPGWSDASPEEIDLPYYFKWEFSTAKGGDFERLARLLERRPMPLVGMRPMDCSKPPYGLPPVPVDPTAQPEVLQLEGALMPTGAEPAKWSNESADIRTYRAKLAEILNLAATRARSGTGNASAETPAVVPPVFGRRHSRQQGVDVGDHQAWMNDLNLDPRQRAAAGLGALVVTKQQEALMTGVWEQLGDIEIANQALAFGQVGLAASTSFVARLERLSVADFFWTMAPLAARLRMQTATGPTSLARLLAGSPIPTAAFDPAFRRMLRRGGGIRKRQGNSYTPPPEGRDILSRLNEREIAAAGPPPTPAGMPTLCEITDGAIAQLEHDGMGPPPAPGVFRVNGFVIDRARRAVVGATVEAWDLDPFFTDKLGDASTGSRGEFRIEFDGEYFRERFLDRRPDLSFKVKRHGRELAVISPRLPRNMAAGAKPVLLEVRDAGTAATGAFRIVGRVVDRTTRAGVSWLTVEVWDRDPLFNPIGNDLLASASTSGNGGFEVAFDKKYFSERGFDSKPDVYFRVRNGDKIIDSRALEIENLPPAPPVPPVIEIEVDAPETPARPPTGPSVVDFCEAAITPELIADAVAASGTAQLHSEAAEVIASALADWLAPQSAPTETSPAAPVDLTALRETTLEAIDPSKTIPARIKSRWQSGPGVVQYGPDQLGRIESRIDFPQPMYAPLAEISQDLILPGVESVPQNTIVFLKTNRRFMEAYMVGLNDALASEVLWRGAPVYPWSTFFQQFWDVSGLHAEGANPESLRDIAPLSTWPPGSLLGQHPGSVGAPEQSVLLLRGDLLKRYPDTLIYAVPSIANMPVLAEFGSTGDGARTLPIFSGSLPPDLTFLGFPIRPDELRGGGPANEGYYIVIEERPGQPRFGFNERVPGAAAPDLSNARWWFDLEWEHFSVASGEYVDGTKPNVADSKQQEWETSSAAIANFCLRRPVRIALHARKLLSDPPSS